tara:strand:+ start:65 stop:550 length:486 start_codon:yes stop_codon:yes gene_type:complete
MTTKSTFPSEGEYVDSQEDVIRFTKAHENRRTKINDTKRQIVRTLYKINRCVLGMNIMNQSLYEETEEGDDEILKTYTGQDADSWRDDKAELVSEIMEIAIKCCSKVTTLQQALIQEEKRPDPYLKLLDAKREAERNWAELKKREDMLEASKQQEAQNEVI